MTVLSITLYWKVSSFTRGMQTDKTKNTVISMVLAWGRKVIIPLHRPGHTFIQVISPGPHFCLSHFRSPYAVLSYITKIVSFHFNKFIFTTLFQNMNFLYFFAVAMRVGTHCTIENIMFSFTSIVIQVFHWLLLVFLLE